MTSKIKVKATELTKLHNALLYAGAEKVNAIGFGDEVMVEVKHRSPEQLFEIGRMIDKVPDKKVDAEAEQKETK